MGPLRLAETVSIVNDEHGAVLLNTRDATMFGLNPSAAVFCAALAAGSGRENATRAVQEAFDAEESVICSDIDALVIELARRNLIVDAP
jgi:hypothetical protein